MSNELAVYGGSYGRESFPRIRAVLGAEQAPDAVLETAVAYCQAAGLDILKKPVAIISYGGKNQIVFTIAAITTIASRAGWAGSDEIQYGPMIKHGAVDVPEWGSQVVYKMIQGQRCPFTGPKVYFRERAQSNQNWTKQPMAMFNKCILSAALRTAFPEALAHAYEGEEIYQPQVMVDNSGVEALKAKPVEMIVRTPEPEMIEMEEVALDDLADMKKALEEAKTQDELKSIGEAIKAYGEMPDDKRKELLAVFSRKRKELS